MDEETLRALKALADPIRVRVLGLLAERPRTAAELAAEVRRGRAPLGQAALARHLDVLRGAGLVRDVGTPAGPALALRVERLGELGRALDALERRGRGLGSPRSSTPPAARSRRTRRRSCAPSSPTTASPRSRRRRASAT